MDIAAAAEALQKFSGTNLTDALSRIERSLGMPRDYIYRMRRLARNEIAATRFTIDEDMRDLWRSDFLLAASKVAAARRASAMNLRVQFNASWTVPLSSLHLRSR